VVWYDKDVSQNIREGSFDIGLDPIGVYQSSASSGQRGVSVIGSAAKRPRPNNGTEVRQGMEMTGCEEVQGACQLLAVGIRLDCWPDYY
jgi:hypothetical protein